jgi:hypothetical protein
VTERNQSLTVTVKAWFAAAAAFKAPRSSHLESLHDHTHLNTEHEQQHFDEEVWLTDGLTDGLTAVTIVQNLVRETW